MAELLSGSCKSNTQCVKLGFVFLWLPNSDNWDLEAFLLLTTRNCRDTCICHLFSKFLTLNTENIHTMDFPSWYYWFKGTGLTLDWSWLEVKAYFGMTVSEQGSWTVTPTISRLQCTLKIWSQVNLNEKSCCLQRKQSWKWVITTIRLSEEFTISHFRPANLQRFQKVITQEILHAWTSLKKLCGVQKFWKANCFLLFHLL